MSLLFDYPWDTYLQLPKTEWLSLTQKIYKFNGNTNTNKGVQSKMKKESENQMGLTSNEAKKELGQRLQNSCA